MLGIDLTRKGWKHRKSGAAEGTGKDKKKKGKKKQAEEVEEEEPPGNMRTACARMVHHMGSASHMHHQQWLYMSMCEVTYNMHDSREQLHKMHCITTSTMVVCLLRFVETSILTLNRPWSACSGTPTWRARAAVLLLPKAITWPDGCM